VAMPKRIALLIVTLVVLLGLVTPALAVSSAAFKIPPAPTGPNRYVSDWANILSPEEEAKLVELSTQIEAKSGTEIAFVTIELDDPDGIDHLAPLIGDAWGVGKKEASNGYVIAASAKPGDFQSTNSTRKRNVFIATGLGSGGVVTDIQATDIFEQQMKPLTKQNKWGEALLVGGTAVAKLAAGEPATAASEETSLVTIIFFIIVVLAIIGFLVWFLDLSSYGGGGGGSWSSGSSGGFGGGSSGGFGGGFGGGGFGGGGGGGGGA